MRYAFKEDKNVYLYHDKPATDISSDVGTIVFSQFK